MDGYRERCATVTFSHATAAVGDQRIGTEEIEMIRTLMPVMLIAATAAQADVATVPIAGTELDVSAVGTVSRVPDVATIGAGVVTQDDRAGNALASNAQRMTATVAALKRAGIADRDIQTRSINLQPQYRYAENQPPLLTGYQASNRVEVRLRDLARAGAVVDALVTAGANQIDGPTLAVDKPEAALDEARQQAIASARSRAELYAKSAGLTVRRIVRISESESGPSVIRPLPMMAMRKGDATPVTAGEQDLSVTLSVTFELN